MPPFLQSLRQLIERLSAGQKAALAAVLLGSMGLLVGVAYWANRPDFALLFGRLEPTEASRIVESLQGQGVRYELREGGTAIYVPRTDVYELRLRFAGEGVVSDGLTGYELFDKGTLGMTDFMQKLNMKRALEGELARTISNIRQVEASRVHLVLPERTPFRETQNRPSASVVIELARGGALSPAQIQGITALVAGAVEGLTPADVNVLDTRGTLLSNPDAANPDALLSNTQLRLQQEVEQSLILKGQSMLDQVLGPGNAIVRVAATLDFSRSVAERETIDPESATVISEEKIEEGVEGGAASNSAVRNYELSRTRERLEKSVGDVSGLTVSVILNHKLAPATPAAEGTEAAEAPQHAPYTDAELAEIEQLVKNAVGFDEARGDRFAIHQTRFDTTGDDAMAAELRAQRQAEQMQQYARYGLMLVALVLAALLLRSATRRLTTLPPADEPLLAPALAPAGLPASAQGTLAAEAALPQLVAADAEDELLLSEDVYTSKLSPEAKARLRARHQAYEAIKQEVLERPEDAAFVIRAWLAEDAERDLKTRVN